MSSAAPRRAAARIVAEIAERLRDPAEVVGQTTVDGTHVDIDGTPAPLWTPQSLTRGYPAVALLYAELGRTDDGMRGVAHRYLELAARQPEETALYGQSEGLCAVATALRVAAHDETDYATILGRLDQHVIANARRLIAVQRRACRDRQPTRPVVVDVVNGLAGLGRYLLARSAGCADTLCEVLSCLSSLREPIVWQGTVVPGWWYHKTALLADADAGEYEHGAAAIGLSHGIAGPLALLALAWRAGYRVPGQEEAMHAMADWLLAWRERDEAGPYWPSQVSLGRVRDRHSAQAVPALTSWCHGSWGTAHAVALAGRTLDRADWTDAATEVVHAVLAGCRPGWTIRDNSLCHGLAAALYLPLRFSWDGVAGLGAAIDEVAARLVGEYQPDAPFGYRYRHPSAGLLLNLPGLLEGAAGIALALHAYATGRPPASGWDSVLMLS